MEFVVVVCVEETTTMFQTNECEMILPKNNNVGGVAKCNLSNFVSSKKPIERNELKMVLPDKLTM